MNGDAVEWTPDVHEIAEAAFSGTLDAPEAWVIRPAYSVPSFAEQFPDVRRGRLRRSFGDVALASSRGLVVRSVPPALFVASTVNQERTLAPIWGAAGTPRRSGPVRVFGRTRRLQTLARTIERGFRDAGARGGNVLERLEEASSRMAVARRLLTTSEARVLVLANQHSLTCRAFLEVARDLRVPSVYIAHAPYADNPAYRDLPVSVAGLRGQREVEAYVRLGAPHTGLHIVGNPSVREIVGRTRKDGPVALALSPHSPEVLARMLRVADEALGDDVVVAPHPAMSVDKVAALTPSRWRIHHGATQDLLEQGVSCVVQRSSGVAWEALARGIPVVELTEDGMRPNYPLIAEPIVPIVTTADALSDAMARLRTSDRDGERRSWAASWCEIVGDEAVDRARSLIQEAVAAEPTWLLDGWRQHRI